MTQRLVLASFVLALMTACYNPSTPAGFEGYVERGAIIGKRAFVEAQKGPTSTGLGWLLEVKNVALLYEMWACFALVKAVRGVLGEPQLAGKLSRDDHQLAVGWDYEVRWAGGTRVLYNVSFSRSHAATRRSYSVPLRPDVVLEVPAGGARQIHVFDAKFKVDWLAGSIPDGEDHQAETENVNLEREGTFKRADIYKMHAYRDAIPAAMSAWALYPGTQLRFFPKEGGGAIEQVSDLPESLEGVGAVPLSSGEVGEELRAVVSQILRGQGP